MDKKEKQQPTSLDDMELQIKGLKFMSLQDEPNPELRKWFHAIIGGFDSEESYILDGLKTAQGAGAGYLSSVLGLKKNKHLAAFIEGNKETPGLLSMHFDTIVAFSNIVQLLHQRNGEYAKECVILSGKIKDLEKLLQNKRKLSSVNTTSTSQPGTSQPGINLLINLEVINL